MGSGFGLSRSESPKRAVWLRGVEIMEMDRQHPAQVASVDDQDIRFAERSHPWRPGRAEENPDFCGWRIGHLRGDLGIFVDQFAEQVVASEAKAEANASRSPVVPNELSRRLVTDK